MSRESYTSLWRQELLIKQTESLIKGGEVTVFKAEDARNKGIKRDRETVPDDSKRQEEAKRHHRHQRAEAKKQVIKNK